MPLGIVSDEEFNKQLPTANKEEVRASILPLITPGRTPDKQNTPEVVRKFIAEEAINGSPAKIISAALDISPSSISAYKVGATSTASYNQPDKSLKQHTDDIRSKIATKARNRLRYALDGITPEKLVDLSAPKLAGVAKDMSAVIRNIEPQKDNDNSGVQFIFYSPRLREENDYPVISVND